MLHAVAALCPTAQLAWEAPMACGYGACYGCVVEIGGELKRLCVDGPVLDAECVNTVSDKLSQAALALGELLDAEPLWRTTRDGRQYIAGASEAIADLVALFTDERGLAARRLDLATLHGKSETVRQRLADLRSPASAGLSVPRSAHAPRTAAPLVLPGASALRTSTLGRRLGPRTAYR